MDSNITLQTKQMIDSLKAVCTNFGLGNASSEYKIITEVFLYKFLNDKFLFEAKRVEPALAKLSPADAEKQLAQMTDDDYELFLLGFGPDTPNVEFSFDVAIIKKNPNGNYMRLVHNKPWNQYTWNEVPRSHQVKDRADDIKEEGLWQEVRDKYLEKKNMYLSWQDHNHPSFVVYVEAVNEVYNRYFNRGGGYSVQSIF